MDTIVQTFIKASRDHGCVLNTAVTAKDIINKTNRMLLEENEGPISWTKCWAKSLLMGFVKCGGSNKVRQTPENRVYEEHTCNYCWIWRNPARPHLQLGSVRSQLCPSVHGQWRRKGWNEWKLEALMRKGKSVCSNNQHSQYNLCIREKTNQCHSRVCFPDDSHITHSPNHWSNETMIDHHTIHQEEA